MSKRETRSRNSVSLILHLFILPILRQCALSPFRLSPHPSLDDRASSIDVQIFPLFPPRNPRNLAAIRRMLRVLSAAHRARPPSFPIGVSILHHHPGSQPTLGERNSGSAKGFRYAAVPHSGKGLRRWQAKPPNAT